MLFSATFPNELETFVQRLTPNRLKLAIGEINTSVGLIKHHVRMCSDSKKLDLTVSLIRNQPVRGVAADSLR